MIENKNIVKGGHQKMFAIFEKYAKDYNFLKNASFTLYDSVINSNTNTIKTTMWETNKLKINDVFNLNKHKVIFVPSESLKKIYIQSGITRPIEVFDPFIDDIYTYRPHIDKNVLVFGLGFNQNPTVSRKNEIQTINYFLEIFADVNDVELWIKTDQILNIKKDQKLKFFYDVFTEDQMLDWYSNIDVFITLSKGEGVGMFNLESMAVGRPLIANPFLTVQEYLNNENGFPLDYDLEDPKDLFFYGCGQWAISKKQSVVNVLKNLYTNKDILKQKGILAAKTAERYKASVSVPKLINKLKLYV